MKFSCNSCNTKYSLPDEKFAGKVITLTCKKCGAKIVVKPAALQETPSSQKQDEAVKKPAPLKKDTAQKSSTASVARSEAVKKDISLRDSSVSGPKKSEKRSVAAQGPTGKSSDIEIKKTGGKSVAESTEPEPKKERISEPEREDKRKESVTEEEESAVWYYSRGGQQKGPYTDEEIREFVHNNVITPKTFVWKEGMMDWMKAGTCPEFSHFLGGESAEKPEKKNAIESLGLDELDRKFREEEVKDRPKEDEKHQEEALQDDFFSREVHESPRKSSEVETDWSKIPSLGETQEEPRENTRIVIMKAGLSESAKRKRMMTRIVMAVVLLGVFVFVFIKNLGPILSAVGVQIKSGIDLEMEDLDKDTLSKMTPEEREKYKKALLGIKETKKLTKEQRRNIAMAITQKKDTDLASILENAKVEGGNIIYENLGKERMGLQGGSGPSLDLDSKLAGMGINTKIDGVDLSSRIGKQDVDLSQKMPDKVDRLNEDIIMMIVNKNRGSVKYCYERHLKASSSLEGKAVFKITIQNSGSVSKVDSLSRQIAGSLFEECIIKEIKKWTFPKFAGEPIVFEVPFILTSIN